MKIIQKYVLYNVEFVHIKKIYEKKYVVYEKEKSVEQYYMKNNFGLKNEIRFWVNRFISVTE